MTRRASGALHDGGPESLGIPDLRCRHCVGKICRASGIRTHDLLTPRRPDCSGQSGFCVIPGVRSCRTRHEMHGLHDSGALLAPSRVGLALTVAMHTIEEALHSFAACDYRWPVVSKSFR